MAKTKPRLPSANSHSDEEDDAILQGGKSSEKAAGRSLESYDVNPRQFKAQMMFKTAVEQIPSTPHEKQRPSMRNYLRKQSDPDTVTHLLQSQPLYEEPESVQAGPGPSLNHCIEEETCPIDMPEEEFTPTLRRKQVQKHGTDHQAGFVTLPNKEKRIAFIFPTNNINKCAPKPMKRESLEAINKLTINDRKGSAPDIKSDEDSDDEPQCPNVEGNDIYSGDYDNYFDLSVQMKEYVGKECESSLHTRTGTLHARAYNKGRKRLIPAPRNSPNPNNGIQQNSSTGSSERSPPNTSPKGMPIPVRKL